VANDNLMSFNGLVGLVARRWALVGLGLAGALALAITAVGHVPPRYETTASVVLLPPQSTVGPGGNPYLAMGGLDAATDVAAAGLSSQAVQQRVGELGATSTVVRDGSTAAPILLISVQASSARSASGALDILVDSVPSTLTSLQQSADVQPLAMMGSRLIASSPEPVMSRNPQLRVLVLALAGGAGTTLVLVAFVDRLLLRRRRRRAAAEDALHATPDERDRPRGGPGRSVEEELADLTVSDRRG